MAKLFRLFWPSLIGLLIVSCANPPQGQFFAPTPTNVPNNALNRIQEDGVNLTQYHILNCADDIVCIPNVGNSRIDAFVTTATPAPTPSPQPTFTYVAPTPVGTASPFLTPTPQIFPTPVPTATAVPTATPQPAPTAVPTATPAPTATPFAGLTTTVLCTGSGSNNSTAVGVEVATCSISGLTDLDQLRIHTSFHQNTGNSRTGSGITGFGFHNTTDNVLLDAYNTQTLGIGGGSGNDSAIFEHGSNVRVDGWTIEAGNASIQTISNITITTAWTGSWTLGLEIAGNSSSSNSTDWWWAVYKVKGQ